MKIKVINLSNNSFLDCFERIIRKFKKNDKNEICNP